MAGEFKLEQVLPWGRNRSEYAAFFDLAALDIGTRILDCAGGPSSFNAEMADRGYRVVSTDPLYQFTESAIAGRVEEARGVMLAGLRTAKDRFVLTHFGTPERVVEVRLAAVRRFLADYESGRKSGRYLVASLPRLPFADGHFDLVLCSHFLFLYSEQPSLNYS